MANIIFKPTEVCNSNCAYCDVVAKKGPRSTMSFEMLKKVFERINEFLLEKPKESITLIWHGGEPLMLGVDYYRKALELQEQICGATKCRIHHSLQTNMTLLNEEFLEILPRLGIRSFGTSYDPAPGVRGAGTERDTLAYNRLFMRAARLAEEHGFSWSFIYVVTRRALAAPLDIFYFLSNLNLKGAFMMNPVLLYGEDKAGIGITPEEYVEFLGAIFPVWWKNRERYQNVRPFSDFVSNIVDNSRSLGCVDAGNCADNHIYIGPDGSASQCGRSADWDIIWYGNINDKKLSEILSDPKRAPLRERSALLKKGECGDCRFWAICHGGCPLDSYAVHSDFAHKTGWCTAKKLFLEKYFEPITGTQFALKRELEISHGK